MELFLLYGTSVVVSFLVLCNAWRREFDLEIGDAALFLFFAILPFVNVTAAITAWVSWTKGVIVWRKK